MKLKRAKVIMLPTKSNKGIIHKRDYENGIIKLSTNEYHKSQYHAYTSNHLYFTTDDEIKKGDWCVRVNKNLTTLCKATKKELGNPIENKKLFKIIATTDKSLKSEYRGQLGILNKYLPQPSQAFIEKYCKLGGIDEVLVEYEEFKREISNEEYRYITQTLGIPFEQYDDGKNYRVKVDSHNTITIHPIKDSWNREEVINLLNNLWYESKNNISMDDEKNNWINKNL